MFVGVPKEVNEVLRMGKVNNQTKIEICETSQMRMVQIVNLGGNTWYLSRPIK